MIVLWELGKQFRGQISEEVEQWKRMIKLSEPSRRAA